MIYEHEMAKPIIYMIVHGCTYDCRSRPLGHVREHEMVEPFYDNTPL